MSEYKYKILWFDDDFESVKEEASFDEKDTRKTFQEDAEMSSDYGIGVVGVPNYEMFCEEIKKLPSYQAVIFDLKGLEKDKNASDRVMPEALELIKANKDLPTFVYSANVTSEKFELTIGCLQDQGRCFPKALGVTPLYEKIVEVLDSNLHYYQTHKECLQLFSKNYLNATANRNRMDELLKMYEAKDKSYSPYNNMRHILEDMLETLVDIGLIDSKFEEFAPRMSYLTKSFNPQKDDSGNTRKKDGKTQWDYENPSVPFSTCRREIKYVLHFLGNITNRYSHFLEDEPEYLRQGELVLEYNYLIQQSVYPAFFVAMKWFYGYMENNIKRK